MANSNLSKSTFRINTATSRLSNDEKPIEVKLTANNIELMGSLSPATATVTTSGVSHQRSSRSSNERQVRNGRAMHHRRRSISSSSSTSSSSSSSYEEERPYFIDPRRERQRMTTARKTEKTRRQIKRKQRYDRYLREREEKNRNQKASPSSRSSRSPNSTNGNQRKFESRKSPSNEQPQIIFIPVPQAGYPMGYNMNAAMMPPMQMPYLPAPNAFQPPMPPPHHYFGPMHPMQMAPPMRPMNVPFRASIHAPFRGRMLPRPFHQQRPF